MKLSSRAKMLLVVAIFALPIAASFIAWRFVRPAPTANHGELLLPPATITPHPLLRAAGEAFRFEAAGPTVGTERLDQERSIAPGSAPVCSPSAMNTAPLTSVHA